MRVTLLVGMTVLVSAGFALAQNGTGNGGDTLTWEWVAVALAIPVLVALGVAALGIMLVYNLLKSGVNFLKELKDKIGQFIDNWPSGDPPIFYRGLVVYQKRLFVDKTSVAPGEAIFISWSFAMRNTDGLTVRIKSVIIVDGAEVKKQEETISAGARGFAISHTMSFPAPGLKQVIGLVTVEQVGGAAHAGDGDLTMVSVYKEELEQDH